MPSDDNDAENDASLGEASAEGTAAAGGGRNPDAVKKYAKIMLYTHPKVARRIKQIALDTDRKANDVILDALDMYFAKHGHTGIKHVIESKG